MLPFAQSQALRLVFFRCFLRIRQLFHRNGFDSAVCNFFHMEGKTVQLCIDGGSVTRLNIPSPSQRREAAGQETWGEAQ